MQTEIKYHNLRNINFLKKSAKVKNITILLFMTLDMSLIDGKGALKDQRQFLTTDSPLKMMKNVFYFTLKALFVFKIFKFLS